jgi:hypothetical protein
MRFAIQNWLRDLQRRAIMPKKKTKKTKTKKKPKGVGY